MTSPCFQLLILITEVVGTDSLFPVLGDHRAYPWVKSGPAYGTVLPNLVTGLFAISILVSYLHIF